MDAGPRSAGDPAIDFTLRDTDGSARSSRQARQNRLLLVAMFKTGCGTCKYSLPFIGRFHTEYAAPSHGGFQVWGISQDGMEATLDFAAQNEWAGFPLLLDADLEVTSEYGITNVPDLYLLDGGGTIRASVLGHFGAEAFNGLAKEVARALDVHYVPVVRDADNAPPIKPG